MGRLIKDLSTLSIAQLKIHNDKARKALDNPKIVGKARSVAINNSVKGVRELTYRLRRKPLAQAIGEACRGNF